MRRNGMKSGLLLSTSVMTAVLGYSRRAYATCTPDPFTPNAYNCAGINAAPGSYSFSGTDISVVVASPTVFFTNTAADQISISGDGDLFFESQGTVILFSGGGIGVDILNYGAGYSGTISIITAYQAPTGPNVWRIEGEAAAIRAINEADGDITMDLDNRLIGVGAGVIAEHLGVGDIDIILGDAGTTLNEGSITATGLDSTDHALIADHTGTGSITITVNGDITSAGGNAINAVTGVNGTGITVNLGDGDIDGGQYGIYADHNGTTGGVSIIATSPTAPGSVTGQVDGITVSNSGAGGITIETGAGTVTGLGGSGIFAGDTGTGGIDITINGGDVIGDMSGISARNFNGGSVTIETNAGYVYGAYDAGIYARNDGGTGSVSVTTGAGGVTGGTDGIYAANTGTGGVTVETGAGAVTGINGDGIDARNFNGGLLDITTAGGDVTGNSGDGINALNNNGTGITITTGAGNVTGFGSGYDGINADNNYTGYITIVTGTGTVEGEADGIDANNSGSGGISITTDGLVQGDDANGILAADTGTGGISITTGAGSEVEVAPGVFEDIAVRGGTNGIFADNAIGGAVTIGTGAGAVIGGSGDGILANSTGADGIEITTGTGNITGGANAGENVGAAGIEANDNGAGGITITVNDSEVTGDQAGILATNTAGGAISITTNAGDIEGLYGVGIQADNLGGGGVTITTGAGSVTGGDGDGINALNQGGTALVDISIGSGGVSGFEDGIDALQLGTGGIEITTTDGLVEGETEEGIRVNNIGSGNVTILTGAGEEVSPGVFESVRGYNRGILVNNQGGGTVDITTADGAVVGLYGDGIEVISTGNVEITTGTGDITGGEATGDPAASGIDVVDTSAGTVTITVNDSDVTGDAAGINVNNQGGGATTITTYAGNILGAYGSGISATNAGGSGLLEITTGSGTVTGNLRDGILAQNFGADGIEITTGTGDITGGAEAGYQGYAGIRAFDTGTGGITITVNDSNVSGDLDGVSALNTNGGAILIETNAGDITGFYGSGINANNTAGGTTLTVTTGDGDVYGRQDGIVVQNSGSGDTTVRTYGGSITGAESNGITASNLGAGLLTIATGTGDVTGGGGDGINARNTVGVGILITTGDGDVVGELDNGITARNYSGYVDITTTTGGVQGADSGINVFNTGAGGVTITTADSLIEGLAEDGIRVVDNGAGRVEITTGAGGEVSPGVFEAVRGDDNGISATDNTGGGIEIATGSGAIIGETQDGIRATANGVGGIVITTATGDITGGANAGSQIASGIDAYDTGAGGIEITVNDSDVTGDSEGIRAFNVGGGAVDITTNAGDILGAFGRGIAAYNFVGTTLTIETGSGTVTGNADDGIFARSAGTGGITITTDTGDIRGGADANNQGASGIEAFDTGAGGIEITVNDSDVTGDSEGIRAYNVAGGSVQITTNAGAILGEFGRGIEAYNFDGTTLTIETGSGDVTGNLDDGIYARSAATGGISITTGDGDILGGDGTGTVANANGIEASNDGSGNVAITTNLGNVTGDQNGIFVQNYGTGSDTTITTNDGNIAGYTSAGIAAFNGAGSDDLTITTNDGTVTGEQYGIFASNSGTGLLSINTGDGDITGNTYDGIRAIGIGSTDGVLITLDGAADITGGRDGIDAYSSSGAIEIDAADATGLIDGMGENGIRARTNGFAVGGITITTGLGAETSPGVYEAVRGSANGMYVDHEGGGLLSITTGVGSITGENVDGIFGSNTAGTGIVITTGSGTVSGFDDGIDLRNSSGYVTINTYDGDVTGTDDGIYADNSGDGDVTITTRDSLISGTNAEGIEVSNSGGGSVFITTGEGDGDGQAVYGGDNGILVNNTGYGSVEITTADGDITGDDEAGIQVYNGYYAEDVTVTLTGAADIFGGATGISITNLGDGGTVVDAALATGLIQGGTVDGINVYNGQNADNGITITTGAGVSPGVGYDAVAVQGFRNGISARNYGEDSITITTGTGAILGATSNGIRAYQGSYGLDISVVTGTGTVEGGENGIAVNNSGFGAVDISTYGEVIGNDGDGIRARNGGENLPYGYLTGTDLTIRTFADVTGSENGIVADNDGTGSLLIVTNLGSVVRGDGGDGINAQNGYLYNGYYYGNALTITTNDEVSGGDRGIYAINTGDGTTTITTFATVTGEGGDGIFASAGGQYDYNTTGQGLTITTNAAVYGQGGDGIEARNRGYGDLTITTNDVVEGEAGSGINAFNGDILFNGSDIVSENLRIYANDAVTGTANGILATNRGSGELRIETDSDAVVTGGTNGIRATNGYYYIFNGNQYGTDLIIITGAAVYGQGGDGIFANNNGTGYLYITTSGIVVGENGNGITAYNGDNNFLGNYGTNLTIDTEAAVTGSDNGIVAVNTGDGDTTIRTTAVVTGEGGDGIYARNGSTYGGVTYGDDLRIYVEDDVIGEDGDGIDARNIGGGSYAELIVDVAAGVSVTGLNGSGILAYNGNDYNGSTYGDYLRVETGTGSTVTGSDRGIGAVNYGYGSVEVLVGGDVTGNGRNGIFAQTSTDGTTLTVTTYAGTTVRGQTEGILAVGLGSGDVTINIQGDEVTGTSIAGISTDADGAVDTIITISAASTVQGGFAGIQSVADFGGVIDIDNAGVLRNLSGLDTALAVDAAGTVVNLTNSGELTGRVDLGSFADVMTNSGTWLTGGTSDFGLSNDLLTNTNVIQVANQSGVSETTVFAGLETFDNQGIVILADDTAGGGSTSFDRLEIAGDFNGLTGSTLRLDAFLGGAGSQADVLVISGDITGSTAIEITNTNPGGGGVGANILLVDGVLGGSTGSEFFLSGGAITVGAFVYDLFWDGEDFFLQSTLDVLRLDAATFPAILGDIWDITAGGWHRNTLQLQMADGASGGLTPSSKGMGGAGVAQGWGTVIFDARDGDGTIIADVGGGDTPVDISFDQNTRAAIGGVDVMMTPDNMGGTLTFGGLLGTVDSRVDFALTGNRADFEGVTYGLHVAYANDVFRADLLVKRDDLNLEYSVIGLGAEPGRADAVSTGASLEFGLKVHETETMTVEAVGNLSHVSTRIDAFTVGTSSFSFDRADTTRGAIGLSFRGNYTMGSTNITPSATVKYWNVFEGGYTSAIDAVAFSYDGTGSYVEASAMLEFDDPNSGWTGFVSGSGFFGGERSGVRAQLGVNLEW